MARQSLAILITAAAMSPAFGQDEPAPDPPPPPAEQEARPWAEGVSEQDQQAAFQLFEQGNAAYLEKNYRGALELYRKAIEHWDHPSIRFNMAECLIHLDRPVEAHAAIVSSLRYGEEALEKGVYDRALTHKKLLTGQLAEVEIECKVAGAQVTLDGEPLFVGPGKERRLVKPGRHQVVASKKGLLTKSEEVVAIPGELANLNVAPVKVSALPVRTERRWSPWKPWTVMGGGAVVATVGTLLVLKSHSDIDEYDDRIAELCATGCTQDEIPGSVDDLKTRADRENVIGISMLAVGGATLVLGATLVILNRPTVVEDDPNRGVRVAPVAAPNYIGAALETTW